MVYNVNDSNLFEHIKKHKKIIWFLFRKGQEENLTIKPFGEGHESVNQELSEQFPDVTIFQSYISDNPLIMEYFDLNNSPLWDYYSKIYNPRLISVKDGQKIYDKSGKDCYCLDTILEMIFELYPELIPIPTSEG